MSNNCRHLDDHVPDRDGNMTQSHSESLTLNGNYAQNEFTLLSDPWGGTEVVYGVQQVWTGGTSDQWNTASNWSNGVVPGTTDTAIIQDAGHQPVTVSDTEQVANLVIDSGATLEIANGGALTVTNALDDAGMIDVNATGSDPTLVHRTVRCAWRAAPGSTPTAPSHRSPSSTIRWATPATSPPRTRARCCSRAPWSSTRTAADRGDDSRHRHLRQCHGHQRVGRHDRGEWRPGAVRSHDGHQRGADRGRRRRHGVVRRQLRRQQRRLHPGRRRVRW